MIVGSRAFFEGMTGFSPKDIDILELVENPTSFKDVRQLKGKGKCVFQWRKMTSNEFIDVTLTRGLPMEIGKFLVPEFATTIGLTIEDLRRLQPMIDRIDAAHAYEKVIYDAYLYNNAFTLTSGQRCAAFEEYKKNGVDSHPLLLTNICLAT